MPLETVENNVVVDFFQKYFLDNVQTLFAGLSWESFAWQLLTVLLAIVLGYFLSRQANALVASYRPDSSDRSYWAHCLRAIVVFVQSMSMSVITGCTISLGSYIMVTYGHYSDNLMLCRLAYYAFFAYAVFLFLLALLQNFWGEHCINPKLKRILSIFFWFLTILHFFGILEEIIAALDSTKVPLGQGQLTLWTILVALITVVFTLGLANWGAKQIAGIIASATHWDYSLQTVVNRIIYIVMMVLAVVFSLGAVGIDLTVLSFFGGALGVGLGFGLQKIASNYVSGFIILLDRSVKVGDLVEVAGFRGRVTAINTRYTVVRNNDGVECIVPNESFVVSAVINHSYTEEASVQYISISIAYDADIDRALEIMREEGARPRPRIVQNRKGWAYLDSFGDSGINLKLGFWVEDPVNGTASLRTEISKAIYRRFVQEGIEVPFNQLEINLRRCDATEVPVKVKKDRA